MVDTGSTLVFLPKDIVNRVFKNVKGLRKDFSGQYIIPCKEKNLPTLTFTMNNNNYTILPEHYVITSGAVSSICNYMKISLPTIDVNNIPPIAFLLLRELLYLSPREPTFC